MTLISVTMTILKPTSPDAGRRTRFAQGSHAIPACPEGPLPMLMASTDIQAGQGGRVPEAGLAAEFGWFSACSHGSPSFGPVP
jgi:hypothetical protein